MPASAGTSTASLLLHMHSKQYSGTEYNFDSKGLVGVKTESLELVVTATSPAVVRAIGIAKIGLTPASADWHALTRKTQPFSIGQTRRGLAGRVEICTATFDAQAAGSWA